MKFFKDITNWFSVIITLYKQIKLDNFYKKIFLQTIREETADRNSEFVKNGFKLGDDEESLISIIKVPLEVQEHGDEYLIQDKLWEQTYFMTDFLIKKAKFDSYVSQRPDFYHIEDPTSSDISLTYLAQWKFVPVVAPELKNKLITYPVCISVVLILLVVLGFVFI